LSNVVYVVQKHDLHVILILVQFPCFFHDLISCLINLNKLTNFCERILNTKGFKDHKKTNFIYVVVWELESIGDEYYHLSEFLSKNSASKTKISKEAISLYEDVNAMFSEFYKAFYGNDQSKLVKINETRNKIMKKTRELYKNKNDMEIVFLNYINNIAQRINDLLGSTISLNIELVVRQ